MKLNKLKMVGCLLAGLSLVCLSTYSSAADLKIANSTKHNLSFSINHSCASLLGTIESQTIAIIQEARFKKACMSSSVGNSANGYCEAKVFNEANCAGRQIATVGFTQTEGVITLISLNEQITLKGNAFNLFFEGPWRGPSA